MDISKISAVAVALTILTACGGSDSTTPTSPTPTPSPTPTNSPPTISSSPALSATEDLAYSYQVVASDPDNSAHVLTYSLNNAPTGMSINSSGLITWTPTEGVLSSEEVTVVVAEDASATALNVEQSFTVAVTPVNDQLSVQALLADYTLDNGANFSQQLNVSDVDDENNGSDISYSLVGAPANMTVSTSGLIEWTPALSASTKFNITVNVADGGEDGTLAVPVSFAVDALVYQQISGKVANYYTGANIEAAEVTVANGADVSQPVSSSAEGDYAISVVDRFLNERMTLSANRTGFASYSLIIDSSASNLENQFIPLVPSDVSADFDPTQAFTLSYQGIDLLVFAANSLERLDGMPIEGQVSVQATIIDPSRDISIMPGDMLTTNNDEMVPIESFGALDVILTDASGAAVDVQMGQTVDIRIPLSESSNTVPATIPLYYFDTVSGTWVEEGSATLASENGESFYAGTVSHFTTWNADQVYSTILIEGCVVDIDGLAIQNATVRSTGRTYNGSSTARTDANGNFSIPVMMNSTVLLYSANGNQSRTLTVIAGDTGQQLDSCLELSAATATITLTWGQDPRDLDSHFYGPAAADASSEFHVYYSNEEVTIDDSTIYLDVDDTSSFGPEIITIPSFPFAGRYQYVVHEYSGQGNILTSPTRVEIKLGTQTRIFSPNDGNTTEYWHAFDFVVDTAGNITIEEVNQWISGFSNRVMQPQSNLPPLLGKPLSAPLSIKQRAVQGKYYDHK
ncbi:putative Ig domain-containing protein [Paraglaciecola sp. 25GB23A]|uniref:putative Ig domain-containing protein n=1 Tax=Paraglaciecola sp. 25GB23A TaxID=3156068 RepID=UPI0032AF37BE